MKKLFYILCCSLAVLFTACEEEEPKSPEKSTDSATSDKVETGVSSNITEFSATLSGIVNVDISVYNSIEFGIMYDSSLKEVNNRSAKKVKATILQSKDFTVDITELQSNTKYYYCAYLLLNGMQYEYGAVKEFKTQRYIYIPDDDIYEEEVYSDFPETLPEIMVPAKDSVTIAIYVPEGTCNGAILAGSINYYNVSDLTYKFKEIAHEDERWLVVTAPYEDDLRVKAIAITESGVSDWYTQWGMNIFDKNIENVVILQGEGVLEEENGGEQILTSIPNGSVIYIGIKEWKEAPCIPRNKAGLATFTLTATAPLPEGSVVGIVGNINEEELYWNIGNPIIMTKGVGNTWTAKVAVPDKFMYKYVYSLDGGFTWSWDYIEDGYNREMPLDLNAVDTVEEWKGLPYEEYN